MAATYIRFMLALELIAYVAIGAALHRSRGFGYAELASAALATALVVRLAIVCFATAIAQAARSPRAPEERIGVAAIGLILREWHAMLVTNFVLFPFEAMAMRADAPAAPTERVPVVFVHGYFSNRGCFHRIVRELDERSVAPIFTPNFPSAFASIERLAGELHREIERICAATGSGDVILVCHSMGGLMARSYLRDHGAARVRKLVTISTPHHGTVLARLGMGPNVVQMRPGSRFLEALFAAEREAPLECPTASIYTTHDNLVAPQDSARLDGARNHAIVGRGHMDILKSRRLAELLVEELRESGVRVGA